MTTLVRNISMYVLCVVPVCVYNVVDVTGQYKELGILTACPYWSLFIINTCTFVFDNRQYRRAFALFLHRLFSGCCKEDEEDEEEKTDDKKQIKKKNVHEKDPRVPLHRTVSIPQQSETSRHNRFFSGLWLLETPHAQILQFLTRVLSHLCFRGKMAPRQTTLRALTFPRVVSPKCLNSDIVNNKQLYLSKQPTSLLAT